jgi:ABC-type transporter Mla MlaB component
MSSQSTLECEWNEEDVKNVDCSGLSFLEEFTAAFSSHRIVLCDKETNPNFRNDFTVFRNYYYYLDLSDLLGNS